MVVGRGVAFRDTTWGADVVPHPTSAMQSAAPPIMARCRAMNALGFTGAVRLGPCMAVKTNRGFRTARGYASPYWVRRAQSASRTYVPDQPMTGEVTETKRHLASLVLSPNSDRERQRRRGLLAIQVDYRR